MEGRRYGRSMHAKLGGQRPDRRATAVALDH
jgi:hypothetical protein